jgi:hypothetical protein
MNVGFLGASKGGFYLGKPLEFVLSVYRNSESAVMGIVISYAG